MILKIMVSSVQTGWGRVFLDSNMIKRYVRRHFVVKMTRHLKNENRSLEKFMTHSFKTISQQWKFNT